MLYHMTQMYENHSIDIEEWNHTSTLELDCVTLFAYPVYAITHDLFLAVGIGNIVIMILLSVVLLGILKGVGCSRYISLLILNLVITPWVFGMLDYTNMLFFGASQYGVKILIPLLAVLLLLKLPKFNDMNKLHKVLTVCAFVLYGGLLFVSTVSTGIYVMICGIAAIFFACIVDFWVRGTWKTNDTKSRIVLLVYSVVVFALGMIIYRQLYPGISKYQMSLTKTDNIQSLFDACFTGLFQVLGATTNDEIKGMSALGIYYCFKKLLVVILLALSVFEIKEILTKKEHYWIRRILSIIFWFNICLLLFYDTRFSASYGLEYRYLLIGIIPALLNLGIWLNDFLKAKMNFKRICCLYLQACLC